MKSLRPNDSLTKDLLHKSSSLLSFFNDTWIPANQEFVTRLSFHLKTLGFDWQSEQEFSTIMERATSLGLVQIMPGENGVVLAKRGYYFHQVHKEPRCVQ